MKLGFWGLVTLYFSFSSFSFFVLFFFFFEKKDKPLGFSYSFGGP